MLSYKFDAIDSTTAVFAILQLQSYYKIFGITEKRG